MNYEVTYSDEALQDLQVIYDYISIILLEPDIAAKQIDYIMDAADSLEYMPFRHPLYKD